MNKEGTMPSYLFAFFIYLWWYWGLNSGLQDFEAGTQLLEPCLQLSWFFVYLLFFLSLKISSELSWGRGVRLIEVLQT
jgi:hypothetical protein